MASRTAWAGTVNTGDVVTEGNLDSLPGGWIGYVEKTTDQTGISSTIVDITSLSQAVTVGSSRRIRVTAYCEGAVMTNSDTRAELYIREGSTVLQTTRMSTQTAVQDDFGAKMISVVLTPSSGSHTYKVSMFRQAGTGTITFRADATAPSWLLIEDVGPA